MRGIRRILTGAFLVLLLGLAGLLALSAWAIAPFSSRVYYAIETAQFIAKAPFASRLVIGDSRIEYATPPEGVMFVGYGSATSRHLARVTGVLCAISEAQVTIALGINDTKPSEWDEQASRTAFESMARACERDKLWFSAIWPAEPGVAPAGDDYLPRAADLLDKHIAEVAGDTGAGLIEVPELAPGFTYDGVHFTHEVSARYAYELAFPERAPVKD